MTAKAHSIAFGLNWPFFRLEYEDPPRILFLSVPAFPTLSGDRILNRCYAERCKKLDLTSRYCQITAGADLRLASAIVSVPAGT